MSDLDNILKNIETELQTNLNVYQKNYPNYNNNVLDNPLNNKYSYNPSNINNNNYSVLNNNKNNDNNDKQSQNNEDKIINGGFDYNIQKTEILQEKEINNMIKKEMNPYPDSNNINNIRQDTKAQLNNN